ncbi:MAG: 50S ribosome-binding GTPase [Anaerolineales bacterium]|nr:50S ribosome-binding GTPase [Anaerolineales bacterium]
MATTTVVLAGNPNVGKSTVFNALTGADQHVGNYPGKTVQKRSGTLRTVTDVSASRIGSKRGALAPDAPIVTVVDLPGTYSLSPYSSEEEIARDFIVGEQPELVANVVDAVNLERNLYLTTQILETGAPVVVCLNMLDQATAQGIVIDLPRLSQLLGNTPIVPLVARRGEGLEALQAAVQTRGNGPTPAAQVALVDYGRPSRMRSRNWRR